LYTYQDINGWNYEVIAENILKDAFQMALDNQNYPHFVYYSYDTGEKWAYTYAFKDITGWHYEAIPFLFDFNGVGNLSFDSKGYLHFAASDRFGGLIHIHQRPYTYSLYVPISTKE
jgi:hypothetical protein